MSGKDLLQASISPSVKCYIDSDPALQLKIRLKVLTSAVSVVVSAAARPSSMGHYYQYQGSKYQLMRQRMLPQSSETKDNTRHRLSDLWA